VPWVDGGGDVADLSMSSRREVLGFILRDTLMVGVEEGKAW
jgi:hypothetical protein